MDQPELSVVIVSWNTRGLLQSCIETVARAIESTESAVEVLVVDNGSSDETAEMIMETFPNVHLIRNDHNLGFARANNQGLAQARGRYLMLLNPDTEVNPTSIAQLLTFMDGNERAAVLGPKLVNPDGSLQISCYPMPTLLSEFWRMFHLDRLFPIAEYPTGRWQTDRDVAVDVAQGACLLLRREALEQVGGLDESYFMYTEEVDLCHRLQQQGWTIHWVPSAVVMHYGGQSTKQSSRTMFLELYTSKIQFFRKNYGKLAAIAYKIVLMAASLVRLAFSPIGLIMDKIRGGQSFALAGNYARLILALPSL